MSENKEYHEFRFSIVRIVISVSNVTSPGIVQKPENLPKICMMQLLGDGSADAARRRGRAAAEETRAQRERQAQWVCMRQGQAIIRHGFGKLD